MTPEAKIHDLEFRLRSLQQGCTKMCSRVYQMTKACEAMQRIIKENGIDHPCLKVKFPIIEDYENIPALHAHEQLQPLRDTGLLRDWRKEN